MIHSQMLDRTTARVEIAHFWALIRSEWLKLRTVRGWAIGMVAVALATVIVSVLSASFYQRNCDGPGGCPAIPIGPNGEAVVDSFQLVHRSLVGNGTLTARVTDLNGLLPPPGKALGEDGPPAVPLTEGRPGLMAWAKAGLIIVESTKQGSSYAAIMVTGEHGVRMQYDYTHDIAGSSSIVSANSPRWLRLRRSGSTIIGEESGDGEQWTRVGIVHLSGLPSTVQAGLFVTSPQNADLTEHPFVTEGAVGPTQATATFDRIDVEGAWSAETWREDNIGGPGGSYPALAGSFHQIGDAFTVTGSGDIAPQVGGVDGVGITIVYSLEGAFVGLLVIVVLGTRFITAEYGQGLISLTLAANPRRGRILVAKVVVLGVLTFVVGLIAAAGSMLLGVPILRANHASVYPVSTMTELRVIVGTAGILAVAAVLALAMGTIFRRGAMAVAVVIVLLILPYILFPGLPARAAVWVLRVTPAAAFAVQQTLPRYSQVDATYSAVNGYYPLSPWAGFGVLCAYAGLALAVAFVLLRKRDV